MKGYQDRRRLLLQSRYRPAEELIDLGVILNRFMVDKEAHKKIPRLESWMPKLWDKIDRMYKYKQKGNEDR